MHLLTPILCLAGLIGPAVGIGLSHSARQVQLYKEMGLDPQRILDDGGSVHSKIVHAANQATVPVEYATIPIDHDDESKGTYQNRYWVNDQFYKPGSPVFLYDGGETSGDGSKLHLTTDQSFFYNFLKEYNAIGIVWEHRYYGSSHPLPIGKDADPDNYKYLTTRQALADIPHFAQTFNRSSFPDSDLTPKGTPWVMFGGSYAGNRAIFTRSEYPETIFAAYSSSAPVQAQVNMSFYFDTVRAGMIHDGFANCTKDIHAALGYIDAQLADPSTTASIKNLFLGEGAENNTNEDFTAALAHIYDFFQSYGTGGTTGNLDSLCDHISFDDKANKPAGPDGLAPSRGAQYVAERWASWPLFVPLINTNMELNCKQLNESQPLDCHLGRPSTNSDFIAWTWQYCTEWGFYQSNNFGPHALLSGYQTAEYQQEICDRQFPEAVKRGILPAQPQAELVNAYFGGWDVRPSNVYTSGGEFDPWRTLSLLSTEEFAPDDVVVATEVPGCGVPMADEKLFGMVIPGVQHCFDFQLDNEPGKKSREVFRRAMKEWLPCFGK